MTETNELEKLIKLRLNKRLSPKLFDTLYRITKEQNFFIAGNSLNKELPNDIDIFPTYEIDKSLIINKFKKLEEYYSYLLKIISETKNAITFKYLNAYKENVPEIYQYCFYYKGGLKELVESFDFAHIKIGASVNIKLSESNLCTPEIKDIYISDDYIKAKLADDTFYTRSDYPLSSLARLVKYAKRDSFAGRSYIRSIIQIVTDIIERGFKDYDDFKDQLDAIDINLLTEDMENLKGDDLLKLFDLLRKDK
jgi:hypothetical protein